MAKKTTPPRRKPGATMPDGPGAGNAGKLTGRNKLLLGGAAAAGVVVLALVARNKGTSSGSGSAVLPVAYSNASDNYTSLEAQIAQLQAVVARDQHPSPRPPRKPAPHKPARHKRRKPRVNPGGLNQPAPPRKPRRHKRRRARVNPGGGIHVPHHRNVHRNPGGNVPVHSHRRPPRPRKK